MLERFLGQKLEVDRKKRSVLSHSSSKEKENLTTMQKDSDRRNQSATIERNSRNISKSDGNVTHGNKKKKKN